MKRFNIRESYQKGSMMIEALALLGLITMVTPILYKKAAERTTELQDINVATQMRTISSAVDQYIKDRYKTVGEEHGGETTFALTDAEMEEVAKYLPHGFDLTGSKLFNDFEVAVRKREVTDINNKVHNIFTSAVLAPLRDSISMMRSSKIASMIGANGGVYRNNQIDGVQGTWQATLGDYGLEPEEDEPSVKDGSLVVVSTKAIASAAGGVSEDDVLYRVYDEDEEKNTMQTTLYMDGNDLASVGNLIAKDGTITIGDDENDSNLDILGNLLTKGTSNLVGSVTVGDGTISSDLKVQKGNLEVIGNANVSGTGSFGDKVTIDKPEEGGSGGGLDVTGDTSLTGGLSQSGGSVSLGDTSNTMELKASTMTGEATDITLDATDITLTATGTATVSGAGVVLSGTNSVDIGTANQGIFFEEGVGTTVEGKTTFNDEVTFNDKVTLTGTGGEITLDPNDADGSKVTAEWVVANRGFKLASGNFEVTNAGLVYKDSANGNRININDSESYIGMNNGSAGLTVTSSSTKAQHDNTYMELMDGSATLAFDKGGNAGGNTWVRTAENEVTLGVGTGGNISTTEVHSLIKATDSEVEMVYKPTGGRDSSVYLSDSGIAVGSPNMLVDEYGIALAGTGVDFDSGETSVSADGSISSPKSDGSVYKGGTISVSENEGVFVSRKGIIDINTGLSGDGGYIRARRLVSDIAVPGNPSDIGFVSGAFNEVKEYDYYQVNPAYTSVMNDIKLITRGGARLSDILPDYINKGVYVADNTYQDGEGELANGWEESIPLAIEGQKDNKGDSANLESCGDDGSCIASPWLGFVPAPLCPPSYDKGITINPFKWRMSEVYNVNGDHNEKPIEGLMGDAYKDVLAGDKFYEYFTKSSDPKQAVFKLEPSTGGEPHTHEISNDFSVLNFQTNTWLNTTMSHVDDDNNIEGWHIVMGFVYPALHYKDLLTDLGLSANSDEIYWNIFPVYAGDMGAFANVYCIFQRKDDSGDWYWGDYVDKYDQIYNYSYSDKNLSGIDDPDLGYDNPW